MKIPKIPVILNDLKSFMIKKSPEILTGIGVTGMVTAMGLGVLATPRALILLDEEVCAQNPNEDLYKLDIMKRIALLPRKDIVRVTWKCYIPTAVVASTSIACIVGGSKVNHDRNVMLGAAYALSETAMREFQEKTIETIGENKVQAIRDSIARDRMVNDPVTSKEVIITERGNTLCYDGASGRYFKSDMDTLKKTEACLNLRIRNEMYIPLNDFYYEIGLPATSIGDDLGWHVDDGYVELKFSSQLASDGDPCLVVDYKISLLPPARS